MGEKYGLTKAFVLEEIENYGIKGRALQTIGESILSLYHERDV